MDIPQELLDLCHRGSFVLHLIPFLSGFLLALVHTETKQRSTFDASPKGFIEAIEWLRN